jgi:prepilin-type N-terminal cleavage/methylation domain-containing protein
MQLPTPNSSSGTFRSQKLKGFSLVEMLVVIAIIGILAAITIPSLLSDVSGAKAAASKRNAQTIATCAQMALAAGDTTVKNSPDMESAIGKLMNGVRGQGVLKDSVFNLSRLGVEEINAAKPYLQFNAGVLSLR